MRVAALLILLTGALFGCSEAVEEADNVEEADYKAYFSETAVDGKPRFYVYSVVTEEDGEAFENKAIRSVSKISKNKVELVEYSYFPDFDTIVRVDSTIMEMRNDGIYTIKSHANDGGLWKQLSMKPMLSIPWKWKKGRNVLSSWSATYKDELIKASGEQAFSGFKERTLADFGKTSIAVREGFLQRKYGGDTMESKIEIWNVKGLGLYRYKSVTGASTYVMEYEREISQSEYLDYLGR